MSEVPADARDILVVAVKVGERQVGLAVDRLLGEQEVVIKSLGDLIGDVPGLSSAAILGDGTCRADRRRPGARSAARHRSIRVEVVRCTRR